MASTLSDRIDELYGDRFLARYKFVTTDDDELVDHSGNGNTLTVQFTRPAAVAAIDGSDVGARRFSGAGFYECLSFPDPTLDDFFTLIVYKGTAQTQNRCGMFEFSNSDDSLRLSFESGDVGAGTTNQITTWTKHPKRNGTTQGQGQVVLDGTPQISVVQTNGAYATLRHTSTEGWRYALDGVTGSTNGYDVSATPYAIQKLWIGTRLPSVSFPLGAPLGVGGADVDIQEFAVVRGQASGADLEELWEMLTGQAIPATRSTAAVYGNTAILQDPKSRRITIGFVGDSNLTNRTTGSGKMHSIELALASIYNVYGFQVCEGLPIGGDSIEYNSLFRSMKPSAAGTADYSNNPVSNYHLYPRNAGTAGPPEFEFPNVGAGISALTGVGPGGHLYVASGSVAYNDSGGGRIYEASDRIAPQVIDGPMKLAALCGVFETGGTYRLCVTDGSATSIVTDDISSDGDADGVEIQTLDIPAGTFNRDGTTAWSVRVTDPLDASGGGATGPFGVNYYQIFRDDTSAGISVARLWNFGAQGQRELEQWVKWIKTGEAEEKLGVYLDLLAEAQGVSGRDEVVLWFWSVNGGNDFTQGRTATTHKYAVTELGSQRFEYGEEIQDTTTNVKGYYRGMEGDDILVMHDDIGDDPVNSPAPHSGSTFTSGNDLIGLSSGVGCVAGAATAKVYTTSSSTGHYMVLRSVVEEFRRLFIAAGGTSTNLKVILGPYMPRGVEASAFTNIQKLIETYNNVHTRLVDDGVADLAINIDRITGSGPTNPLSVFEIYDQGEADNAHLGTGDGYAAPRDSISDISPMRRAFADRIDFGSGPEPYHGYDEYAKLLVESLAPMAGGFNRTAQLRRRARMPAIAAAARRRR